MEQDRLDKLVFINYNKRLYERFQTRRLNNNDEDFDPIRVDELNYSSKWMTRIARAANEFVYGEEGLTWAQVDAAIGASEFHADHARRSITQARPTSIPTTRGCRRSYRNGRGRGRPRAHGRGTSMKTYSRKGKEPMEVDDEEEFQEEEEDEEEESYEEEEDDENEFGGQFEDFDDDEE